VGALIRRQKRGIGALIEISLLESLLDFQFELLTTYFASNQQPRRSDSNNGHTLLSAPYGIYKTADGYIALAMMDIIVLAKAINCKVLEEFSNGRAFAERNKIKAILARHLSVESTRHWLACLHQQGLWAMEVFDWEKMMDHKAYQSLQMEQVINTGERKITTTRCPIRINGERLYAGKPAPKLGEHTVIVVNELINNNVT